MRNGLRIASPPLLPSESAEKHKVVKPPCECVQPHHSKASDGCLKSSDWRNEVFAHRWPVTGQKRQLGRYVRELFENAWMNASPRPAGARRVRGCLLPQASENHQAATKTHLTRSCLVSIFHLERSNNTTWKDPLRLSATSPLESITWMPQVIRLAQCCLCPQMARGCLEEAAREIRARALQNCLDECKLRQPRKTRCMW